MERKDGFRLGRLPAILAIVVLTVAGSAFVLSPRSLQAPLFAGIIGCEADCPNGECYSSEDPGCCYCDDEGNAVCDCNVPRP